MIKGMSAIRSVALNTFREIIRDRILYGLIVFAILLIGFSLALGQLSFAEQGRITTNFGFAAIHISAAILSIFVGSTLVGREIEKKTILTLLARPISRTQFLLGKSIGLLSVISVSIFLLALVLVGILATQNLYINSAFLVGLYGILLEAAVLLFFTIFFGSFASPMMSVSFTIGIFLIGHWIQSLKYFSDKSASASFQAMTKVISSVMPNLELFNWRSLFVYSDPIPFEQVFYSSFYAIVWCIFLVATAAFILGQRDLG